MKSLSFKLLFLAFFLPFCFAHSARNRIHTVVPAYDFSEIDKKITSWIDSGYYKGASLVVAKDNRIIHRRFYGNYTPETVAYIASAGKWLAAATIAAVVDEGTLSWNDKVKKWLPQFTGVKGDATLRQLLSHTSGFSDYQPAGVHPDNYQTLEESINHIVGLPADTVPGAVFHYGGLAMQVAGRMAEVATGKDWETLFQEKIACPLKMKFTHFTPVDATPGHNPMLGGGARTSLQDYANFLSMILNNGQFEGKSVLSELIIKEMQADQVGAARVNNGEFVQNARQALHKGVYGLGEWREELDSNGNATLISSPGWAGAYPWIDKKNNVYGFFLTRVTDMKNGFSSFYASPVLPYMVRDVLVEADYPKTLKKGFLSVNKTRLYYEEMGKGEPVVFIHGHSLDHKMWDRQFFELAKKYHVIRYDLRGYGKSDMPLENVQFLHADDLKALMEALHISKAHLVGLSLGGFVATDMLALYPNKIITATLASGNIFHVPGPDQPMDQTEKEKRASEITALKKKGIDVMKREWFNALMRLGGSQKERMRAPLWTMIDEWSAWQPLHLEPRVVLGNSVINKLKQNPPKVPVLVLEGKSPSNHYSFHPEVLDYLPQGRLELLEDAGHMMNMEQPEAFNKSVLTFIANKK